MQSLVRYWFALSVFAVATGPARAEVTRFEITTREPFADGKSFGAAGPYERIVGRVHYALDPDLKQNESIRDLGLAPRNKAGKVELSADVYVLAPRELSRGNKAVFYEVNNRGRLLAMRFFNDGPLVNEPQSEADAGQGFFMRHGFTVVWSGWDGELLPGGQLQRLDAPVATDKGKPITGLVRYEVVPPADTRKININCNRPFHGSYRPTEKGLAEATLTWRLRPDDPRVPIPRSQFHLHVSEVEPVSPGQLPLVELEVSTGLRAGYIYEVIYEARDPLVHGVCYTAVRDLISAFKHGTGVGNPLAPGGRAVIERAHAFGVSQSGRFLREMLYWGINEDEQGRQVFDGVIPHVAGGGLGSFNHRFAQPTAFASQHEMHHSWSDRFPFAYEDQQDPLSGQTDGILRRCVAAGIAPKIMHTHSTAEYWTRSGSLPHTDPLGTRDAVLPENVRVYAFGGTQHGPADFPPPQGEGQHLENPGDYRPLLRALLLALDRWCSQGIPPPESVYPRIANKTLVPFDQTSTGFPSIPGVRYPEVIQQPPYFDLGPRWQKEGIVDALPPRILGHYKVLVPRCGPDGNELGCLAPPEVAVPVATYTPWSLRRRDIGAENELVSLKGSYVPLQSTESAAKSLGDPRQPLEKRYGSLDKYLEQLQDHCRRMVAQGYLLEEDSQRVPARQRDQAVPLFTVGK